MASPDENRRGILAMLAAMALVAMALLAVPLVVARRAADVPRAALDVALFRDQLSELERERELLNAIANHAPSLLCLVGADGLVRPAATNIAFERRLG